MNARNRETEHGSRKLTRSGGFVPATEKTQAVSPALKWWSHRHVWVWAVQVLVAILLGYMIIKGSSKLKEQQRIPPQPGIETSSDASSRSGLNLQVSRQGEDLRLSWDRSAPVLAEAKGGALTIRDGNRPGREVVLDEDLLKTGSVVYRPVEQHVSFQLAVFGPGSSKIADSVTAFP
jgi:hypothetical protein